MAQLTIDLPDKLALRLQLVEERVPEVIELGLREISPLQTELYGLLIDFFAHGPTQQDILAFRPPEESIERVRHLLDKNRMGLLAAYEQSELDQYLALDTLLTQIKKPVPAFI